MALIEMGVGLGDIGGGFGGCRTGLEDMGMGW